MAKLVAPIAPKKYRKVTPQINFMIHKLYNDGWKQVNIARRFNLSNSTITKILHEKSHKKSLENAKKHNRKYLKDPKYRKKINEAIRKNVKKRYKNDPRYKKYLIDYSSYSDKKNKERVQKYNHDYYMKNKVKLLKRKKILLKEKTNAGQRRTSKRSKKR